mmetsp:Transcript_49662/g.153404  ORF Transcript_49662/g.153404 Transcript_49662/m.153404 type:complete len:502 (+) Transcript_49662:1284-2789(+)
MFGVDRGAFSDFDEAAELRPAVVADAAPGESREVRTRDRARCGQRHRAVGHGLRGRAEQRRRGGRQLAGSQRRQRGREQALHARSAHGPGGSMQRGRRDTRRTRRHPWGHLERCVAHRAAHGVTARAEGGARRRNRPERLHEHIRLRDVRAGEHRPGRPRRRVRERPHLGELLDELRHSGDVLAHEDLRPAVVAVQRILRAPVEVAVQRGLDVRRGRRVVRARGELRDDDGLIREHVGLAEDLGELDVARRPLVVSLELVERLGGIVPRLVVLGRVHDRPQALQLPLLVHALGEARDDAAEELRRDGGEDVDEGQDRVEDLRERAERAVAGPVAAVVRTVRSRWQGLALAVGSDGGGRLRRAHSVGFRGRGAARVSGVRRLVCGGIQKTDVQLRDRGGALDSAVIALIRGVAGRAAAAAAAHGRALGRSLPHRARCGGGRFNARAAALAVAFCRRSGGGLLFVAGGACRQRRRQDFGLFRKQRVVVRRAAVVVSDRGRRWR